MTTFIWILYPYHEYLPVLTDEFIVKQLRLRVQVNSLKVDIEAPTKENGESQARELAERYVKTLVRQLAIPLRLITTEEFPHLSPLGMIIVRGLKKEEHQRVRDAIRKARREMLAQEHVTLRRCYDYLQDAHENPQQSLFYLYKAVEVIEHEFGGERQVIEVLHVGTEVKFIKRLANESARDQRHPPKGRDKVKRPEMTDHRRAAECATRLVRAYEEYVRQHTP